MRVPKSSVEETSRTKSLAKQEINGEITRKRQEPSSLIIVTMYNAFVRLPDTKNNITIKFG